MSEFKIDYCHHDSVTMESRQEYIKREDAIKAYAEILKSDKDTKPIAEMILADIPCADVVEIVRCKDCKYSEENCKSPIYGMWCERFGAEKSNLAVLPTDYCSCGEKKDD